MNRTVFFQNLNPDLKSQKGHRTLFQAQSATQQICSWSSHSLFCNLGPTADCRSPSSQETTRIPLSQGPAHEDTTNQSPNTLTDDMTWHNYFDIDTHTSFQCYNGIITNENLRNNVQNDTFFQKYFNIIIIHQIANQSPIDLCMIA